MLIAVSCFLLLEYKQLMSLYINKEKNMRYICNHWFHGGMILAALLAAYGAAAIHFMGNMEKILFLSFMLLLAH